MLCRPIPLLNLQLMAHCSYRCWALLSCPELLLANEPADHCSNVKPQLLECMVMRRKLAKASNLPFLLIELVFLSLHNFDTNENIWCVNVNARWNKPIVLMSDSCCHRLSKDQIWCQALCQLVKAVFYSAPKAAKLNINTTSVSLSNDCRKSLQWAYLHCL